MDEVIRKAQMCYQQSKAKVETNKIWPPKKGKKGPSNFKNNRYGNYKNVARNLTNRKNGKSQQRTKWAAKERHYEASSRPDLGQSQKPPLQCWGCGEAHYFKNCPHRGRNEVAENL